MSASFINVNTDFINWTAYPPSANIGTFAVIGATGATTITLPTKQNYIINNAAYDGSSYNSLVINVPFSSTQDGEQFSIFINGNGGFAFFAVADNSQQIQVVVSNPVPNNFTTFSVGSGSGSNSCNSFVFTLTGYQGGWFCTGTVNGS